ncbi:UDP-N-acetylmuramoyl-L-alanine--D-glutamate ligase [Konateibacter massiliensis]|uniref:UDP-N-acetylmuramoyl-L-alanine--D-glutamate ligase n=1 Tax=Konateibacter massiliensis TaxID=2002841 RepID=UPI000C145203|nr:UDP-N-acetylmuramoyl-L-alanine--D-glutamate ligase [Konateibacter massiliensis]
MQYTGKKVCVIGSGISGIGAAALLSKRGADVLLYDGNEKADRAQIEGRLAEFPKVQIVIGEFPKEVISTLDLTVISPGVPVELPLIVEMRAAGVKIWGEVELAYQCGKGKVVAITGTNGKTTTTALTFEIMKNYFESAFVVGNIGTPYTSVVDDMTENSVTVAEISSFQLETIEAFQPMASAILNITPDHLDRHKTMENYIAVKESIVKNQTAEQTCVLNYEDEELRRFAKTIEPKVIFFSSMRTLPEGVYLDQDSIVYHDGKNAVVVCKTDELNLLGRHNHENVMAAIALAISMEVPLSVIRETVMNFVAVEHRIEFVQEKNGVAYYNDSKGTNPDAAIKGIQAMNRPTILIGGGYDKNSEYEEWIQAFDGKVRYLVLIGQTREKIADAAKRCGFHDIIFAETLEEAVKISAQKAGAGDAVLLSPACASWGMFKNYEERGRMFKDYVRNL